VSPKYVVIYMISFIIDSFVAHGWNYYRYVIKVKS